MKTQKKEKTNVKVYKTTGTFMLKGVIKVGLDTSVIYDIITGLESKEYFKSKGYQFPKYLLYYHEASFNEVVGLLINKKKMGFEEAKKAMNQFIDDFNVEFIKRDDNSKEYEEIVRKVNEEVVKQYGEDCKIGPIDIIIIAGFLQNKMTSVEVRDKGFEKTCEKLDMNHFRFPTRDKIIEDKLKKVFKKH
ncbi:MAG: hypothetical protein AABW57_00010 [Nanoarchaeota archaeon]